MGLGKKIGFFLMVMSFCWVSMGEVYRVGDSTGWTNIGHVDYKTWSANKNFHVGDSIREPSPPLSFSSSSSSFFF